MTRCLDEAKLQSYFDGELSIELMESVTSHLASCVTCAAAAREVEQETALFTEAFSAEFEASVPTERLRQRIDAAVLGERRAVAQTSEKSGGLASFLSSVLNFGTQRTLGYASLAVLVAFVALLGVVKMRNTANPATETSQPKVALASPQVKSDEVAQVTSPSNIPEKQPIKIKDESRPKSGATYHAVKFVPNSSPKTSPVKLFPGERSYLQTIAKLDSTIKSSKKAMRPSLQVEYERNLAVVDRAIAATRTAAKSNPSDPDTADFMFAAYQSKVDLLNTIADARVGGGRGH
jgi:Putative zinc-finger